MLYRDPRSSWWWRLHPGARGEFADIHHPNTKVRHSTNRNWLVRDLRKAFTEKCLARESAPYVVEAPKGPVCPGDGGGWWPWGIHRICKCTAESWLGRGFNDFLFSPGEWSNLTHIFQMGWFNHHPGELSVSLDTFLPKPRNPETSTFREKTHQAALANSPETLRTLEECGLPLTQALKGCVSWRNGWTWSWAFMGDFLGWHLDTYDEYKRKHLLS